MVNPAIMGRESPATLSGQDGGGISSPRPIIFWITMLAALIAVIVLLREVLLPFVAGLLLAYLLDPLATRLERLGMSRLIATLTIVGLFVVGIAGFIFLMAPMLVSEIAYFVDQFPLYIKQLHGLAIDKDRPWLSKIVGEGLGQAERSINELTALAADSLDGFLHSVWSGSRTLISVFSLSVVTPMVACYLIYDWKRMIATIDNWVPPSRRDTVRSLAHEIDDTIGGFMRGQGTLCFILCVYYAAALSLTGLTHGMLIGVAAGLLSFVPYLGSLGGLAVSTCVAVAVFWPNWLHILIIPAIFLVGQTLADYVLSPHLIGRRIHLGPVWVIFALFAFGYLFGFVGLVIAVPLAAALGVLMRFAMRHYYASPLYTAVAVTNPRPAMPFGETAG
jgi:predicted PurR-regulated permease PerM